MANTIKIGSNSISGIKFGTADVDAVYVGDTLVYSGSTPPSPTGIPSSYTEVEYVENKTLAFINTGFKPNQNTRIVTEMQIVTSTSGGRFVGAGGYDGVNAIQFDFENGATGTLHISWGGYPGWSVYNNCVGDYNKHTYEWDGNTFYRDKGTQDEFSATTSYTTYQCTDDLAIFTRFQNGSGGGNGEALKGRLYSFKLYDNGTLVRNLIPCVRNSDGKVGVYDLVGGQFYSSANSNYELVSPLTPVYIKWVATYSDSSTVSGECDTTVLAYGEIQDTYNVVSLKISGCVTSIESFAMINSSLTSLTIGSNVTSIGDMAFSDNSSLTSITCEAITPPNLGFNVFNGTNSAPIYVPGASLSQYQSAWSDYSSRLQAIP